MGEPQATLGGRGELAREDRLGKQATEHEIERFEGTVQRINYTARRGTASRALLTAY
jgi:hypothetical protein